MDTEWFAVDACGHVAHFATGEAGAVPHDAPRGEDRLDALRLDLPPCEVLLDPDHARFYPSHVDPARAPGRPVRALLDTPTAGLDVVLAAVRAGRARVEPAVRGVVVVFAAFDLAVHEVLHRDGLCLGCGTPWNDLRLRLRPGDDYRVEAARVGMFEYGHREFENWICGPYGLSARPSQAIKATQLPPDLRRDAFRAQLAFCFADAPWLQPADHLPVFIMGGQVYVSADGRTVRTQGDIDALVDLEPERVQGLDLDFAPWEPLERPPPFIGRGPRD